MGFRKQWLLSNEETVGTALEIGHDMTLIVLRLITSFPMMAVAPVC